MNIWKCVNSCMGSGKSCEIKLVHDNTPDKCMTNGKPVKWSLQNTSSNSDYAKCQDTIVRNEIRQCRECGKPV
jgi:hypothetical protein